ncbi:MAG: hypothetical protein AAF431_06895 [Pseudomonadota bacterium]
MLETLRHVANFMPFVNRALVCVPVDLASAFAKSSTVIPLQVVIENEILAKAEIGELASMDHQSRNYLLRKNLIASSHVDAHFIMSDDDARPLKVIEKSRFLVDEQYRSYFFHDMQKWSNNQTEFDAGQIATGAVLQCLNISTLSFASHMPQIVDRALFLEAAEFFKNYATQYPLCEWGSYFNYALSRYPDRFLPPQPYATLCWPEHPLAWRPEVTPKEYLFENYTPALYTRAGVFSEESASPFDPDQSVFTSVRKIVRWRRYEISLRHPEQEKNLRRFLNPRTWINKLFRHQQR